MIAVLTEIAYVEVKVTPEGQERLVLCDTKNLCCACLGAFSDGDVQVRGMHDRCSKATWRMIDAGKTTEKERMEQGKMRAKATPGRKPTNPVTKELAGR